MSLLSINTKNGCAVPVYSKGGFIISDECYDYAMSEWISTCGRLQRWGDMCLMDMRLLV